MAEQKTPRIPDQQRVIETLRFLYPNLTSLGLGEPDEDFTRRAKAFENPPASGKVPSLEDPRHKGAALESALDLALTLTPGKAGVKGAATFSRLMGKQAAGSFHEAIAAAKKASPHGAAVTLYSPDEYAAMKLFLSKDKTTGFAIKSDGDIVSVFKHPDSPHKNVIDDIMPLAKKHGGTKLDAFDPWLPQQYGKHGFVEKSRLKFSDEHAPEGWNYERDGRPDVVFMKSDETPFKHKSAPYAKDYDEAVRLQTGAPDPKFLPNEDWRSAPKPDAPFPWAATRYPETGPPKMVTYADSGKVGPSKDLTPEAKAFKKERDKIIKDMKKNGYVPYFNPTERFPVDVSHYPPNTDTSVTAVAKKQSTIDKHLEVIGAEETRQRLRDAVARGAQLGDSNHWYWMGQMEQEFRKVLGDEAGREAFKQRFATSMAATTGGSKPGDNLMTAMYGNFLRSNNLPYPTHSYEVPYPVGGGKHGIRNLEQHKRIFDEGGWSFLGPANAKRHDFAWDFMGGDAPVIDEQMTKGMTPTYGSVSNKGVAPYPGTYGLYSRVARDEAKAAGVSGEDYQGLGWFGFKGAQGRPMITDVNEMIERTHRLTGMPRDEIVKRGYMLGQIPMYSFGGAAAVAPGLLSPGEGSEP